MSSLIPNAEQQFFDLNGNPLAGGSVYFYQPGTLTPVNTYQNQALSILNSNPVVLDGDGKAIIWGADETSYRQIVQDSLGNTIWDQVTATPTGAVMTTAGDIVIGGASGAQLRLAIGANGQVLEVVSGVPAWTNLAASPVTTLGDIYVGGTAGAPSRLPIGATGQVVTVVGGVPTWANNPAGFANPMTTQYDLILGGVSGAEGRRGIGTNGQFLGVVSGSVAWVANPAAGVTLANTSQWTANQSVAPTVLAYASTITPNAATSNNFELVLAGNCTLENPTGLVNGMILNFCVDQDATGGRVLTLGLLYKWPGGTVPTWVTTASAKNFFSAYYDGAVLRCNGGAGYA